MPNKKALLKLASLVEKIPDGRLDMRAVNKGKIDKKHPCGTSFCAMGLAGQHPWFNKKGLCSNIQNEHDVFYGYRVNFSINGVPLNFWDAASNFFEIDGYTSFILFNPGYYPKFQASRKNVAKRLRWVAKNGNFIRESLKFNPHQRILP